MWNKLKTVIITVLATLGVLFIICLIIFFNIPDDEDDVVGTEIQEVQETDEDQETQEVQETEETWAADEDQDVQETQETAQLQEDEEEASAEDPNAGTAVSIPDSQIAGKQLKFKTKTLDKKSVDQSVFSDYDITVVHVWGTFCGPCIAEMGDYARFYESKPDNVNLVGIVCDVYDGIDTNADEANEILDEAGAKFINLRTSDSIYDITDDIELIPSSFFVDRDGHIIGEMLIGAHFDATMSKLEEYLK